MESKKRKTLLIIAICAFAILVIGSTYAYFQNQYGNASRADVNVLTYTTDVLTFETGDPINIYADASNFKKGESSKTASTFARATLQANNKTNEATANYDILLDVSNNTLGFTKEGSAELIISIVDKNTGNEVTSIEGLTYVTVKDGNGNTIKGFDITTLNNKITLISNKEINAAPKTVEEYTITVTLVNYDYDQSGNSGKNFSAKLIIKKPGGLFHESCNDDTLACQIAKKYTGVQGENGLYYHDSSLANGAEDNSYRYAGADYILTDAGKALGATNIFSTSATDTSGLIDYYCNNKKDYYGGSCTAKFYFLIKNDSTKYSTYKDVINKAVTDGYLMGDLINNYVCFGSDEEACPVDNLYRIIGVFNGKAKLIKADYASGSLLGTDGDYKSAFSSITRSYKGSLTTSNIGMFYWNYNGLPDHTGDNKYGSNVWSTSLLNITNLNTNYLNNIGSKWAEMIDTVTWKVGGNTYTRIQEAIPSVVYKNEIVNPATSTTYEAKVGLMYVSDYGFAVDPSMWTTVLSSFKTSTITNLNWMYMGLSEWTISPNSSSLLNPYFIGDEGTLYITSANIAYTIRPVWYLNASVKYVQGNGTKNDPIRITY